MVPYGVSGKVKSIKGGDFTVDSTVCVVKTAKGCLLYTSLWLFLIHIKSIFSIIN